MVTTSTNHYNQTLNLARWVEQFCSRHQIKQTQLIKQSVELLQSIEKHNHTPYHTTCIHQSLVMAELIAELNLDTPTIAASILYSALRYTDLSIDDIEQQCNQDIANLLSAVIRMSAIDDLEHQPVQSEHHVENIRRMLLAMIDDVKAVCIKLVERLYLLQNIDHFPLNKQQQYAQQTMDIYAPLASRLGIGELKWQLEDLAFRLIDPKNYKHIAKSLNLKRLEREQHLTGIINQVSVLLSKQNIHHKIKGRAKHIYSIYRKMQRKAITFDKIYDATAIRIFVNTNDDCYQTLAIVHQQWAHVDEEYDDYITLPKPNGYQSIHTAIIDQNQQNIEIQIRTQAMHEAAESGGAAHWLYKENNSGQDSYQQKIDWLRQLLDWQREIADQSPNDAKFNAAFVDRVYVFTPHNQVIDLPGGATVLDFAYYIHTQIGHRCQGAKVNDKIVPLTYQPVTGDLVNILTRKQPNPSRDWLSPQLGYLHTTKAKSKLLSWFKQVEADSHHDDGKRALELELKSHKIKTVDLEQLISKLKYQSISELHIAIGRGEVNLPTIIRHINQFNQPTANPDDNLISINRKKQTPTGLAFNIDGVDNLLTNIAACCQPLPGDSILGYITQGRGVSIHQADCNNMDYSIQCHPERVIKVSWGQQQSDLKLPCTLIIFAEDRPGLIHDISNLLSKQNINIIQMNSTVNPKNNQLDCRLTINVDGQQTIQQLISQLTTIESIIQIKKLAD